ncbi:hypothetical protein XENTR_v10019588 [Xenopus tropicalis]|uniref:Uncharacterized protein n=1 Tax=Xenopus tropicalis TaxID=8364 RepID=A0A1B8XSS4_XENTR|nr:hypothetical protein XENTR_v10019588 [Xenopus tropicalis]KAE8594337.1 hypothetical protein XENTR_v10019588 [Xenopus tropicalis]
MLIKPSRLGRKQERPFDYNGYYKLGHSYQCWNRGQTWRRKLQRSNRKFRAQRMRRVYRRNRNWHYRRFGRHTTVIKILL